MSDDIEVKTHSNEVLDMKGNVIEKTASISFSRPRKGERPDEVGSALIQARHLYNSLEDVTDQVIASGVDGGVSYIQDSKYRFLKVHYYAYGLFWSCLLKAFKNRDDLKEWSPELFQFDETCTKCQGLGKIVLPVGSPEYDAAYEQWKEPFGDDEKPLEYGKELAQFCSPCQGVGFHFNREAYQKQNGKS